MARARELTTTAVLVTLLASMGCFAAGLALAFRADALAAAVVPLGELPAALAAADPGAWLSLGVIFLLLTPLVRLAGMLREFRRDGQSRAAVSAAVVLAMLTVALVLGLQGRKLGQSAPATQPPAAVDTRSR